MSATITRRYRVHGRVQGVFFRASARTAARASGLTGWVRNCADGAVEVEATGTVEAQQELEAWLWRGPPAAQVSKIAIEDCAPTAHIDFEIRR